MARPWHCMNASEVADRLRTDDRYGISEEDVRQRLRIYGENRLQQTGKRSRLAMFLGQFDNFMVLVLLGATALSALMGEMADAISIVLIVVLNSVLGYIQENRAEDSLESLKRLAAPRAVVVREGKRSTVPGERIVPGDILLLASGARVAADCRLVFESLLEVDESPLTGESFPVRKNASEMSDEACALADRSNMVYASTIVTKGTGRAIVVSTGMNTEVGAIASSISAIEQEETPLQKRLESLGRILVGLCLLFCAAVVLAGIYRGEPIYRMVLVGVSLAVAAIPEGLPAVVTISLALGVQRMIGKNAIVRRLSAVETLGCATVICSDKTGTITANQMTVRLLATALGTYDVTGMGYALDGKVLSDTGSVAEGEDVAALCECAMLCNNAELNEIDPRGRGSFLADPTEIALKVACVKAGFSDVRTKNWRRLAELPFDSIRKRMSVVMADDSERTLVFIKGAPDVMLDLCTRVLDNGRERAMTQDDRDRFEQTIGQAAHKALRVLAFARRTLNDLDENAAFSDVESVESELTFLGLMGMIDPPRKEIKEAVRRCHRAGLKTVMITGDHRFTAEAVALEVGIMQHGQRSLSGAELDGLDDSALESVIEDVSVFSRVSPCHKLRIVRAYKRRGHIVAMTGDGVNDAPAVKEASIGVAMGISGTDVTREASDMVLADDNFATIVSAIEEGRSIHDNIRKFIRYLLSCNVGELLIMFLAGFCGFPVALLPIQMLFINLVTDGLPAVALSIDPPSRDLMAEPPRMPDESIFSRGLGSRILSRGFYIGALSFLMFVRAYETADLAYARTVVLCTLVLTQMFHVFDCRSERSSIFDIGFGSNLPLVVAALSSVMVTALIVYIPALRACFHTVALHPKDWALILPVTAMPTLLQAVAYVFRPVQKRRLRF